MDTRPLRVIALAWLVIAAPGCNVARTGEAGPDARASEAVIDQRADELVRAFSDRIRAAQSFHVRVADTLDVLEENGQTVQYAHVREAIVRRPDRVWTQSRGDLVTRELWKDGSTVTLLDPDELVYASIDDPGTIEQMMDVLFERYGVSTPMADLLSDDPYGVLMQDVISARYLGLHLVREEACHHLAFEHAEFDWQLWLSTGDVPMVRKLVITHKHEPGSPQFTMHVLSVERLDDVPESTFQAQLPEGADEIVIIPVDTEEASR